eukprot:scaffold265_cov131-Cylindrotheca_fusiformis.AAC.9
MSYDDLASTMNAEKVIPSEVDTVVHCVTSLPDCTISMCCTTKQAIIATSMTFQLTFFNTVLNNQPHCDEDGGIGCRNNQICQIWNPWFMVHYFVSIESSTKLKQKQKQTPHTRMC